jgi:hypothetical protein
MDQTRAPLYDALEAMRDERIVPSTCPATSAARATRS